jgi:SAM-dependent methyltransferase/uncharacterized protein YbaR (Trm112 family)
VKASAVPLLACPAPATGPRCGGPLAVVGLTGLPLQAAADDPDEIVEGALRCGACGQEYPILSGVAILTPRPRDYIRDYYRSLLRDLGRHGRLSARARLWLTTRAGARPGDKDYGADFRFSQQFETPAAVAEAMAGARGELYGPFGRWLAEAAAESPYDVLAGWAAELPRRRGLLLDAGCGAGGLLARAGGRFTGAFGADFSFLAVLLARRVLLHRPEAERSYLLPLRRGEEAERPLSVPAVKEAEVVVADCRRLPFAAGLFDAVCSSNVIDIVGIEEPLREAARLTAPGGVLLLSDPYYFKEGEAPRENPQEIVRRTLQECGLRIEVERDGVPWAWATYDRHWHVYFSHCLAARRPEPSAR